MVAGGGGGGGGCFAAPAVAHGGFGFLAVEGDVREDLDVREDWAGGVEEFLVHAVEYIADVWGAVGLAAEVSEPERDGGGWCGGVDVVVVSTVWISSPPTPRFG